MNDRLRDAVAPSSLMPAWLQNKGGKEFQGEVWHRGFMLTRIIFYKNAGLPVAIGSIQDKLQGSEVQVTLRLNLMVLCFLCLWTSSLLGMWAIDGLAPILKGETSPAALIPMVGFAVLPWFVFSLAFAWQVPFYQRALTRIITDAEPNPDDVKHRWPIISILGVVIIGGFFLATVGYGICLEATRPPDKTFTVSDPNSPTVVRVKQYSKSRRLGLAEISASGQGTTQYAGWPDVPLPDDAVPVEVIWHSRPTWVEIVFSNGQRLKLIWDEQAAEHARKNKLGRFFLRPRYEAIAGPVEQPKK